MNDCLKFPPKGSNKTTAMHYMHPTQQCGTAHNAPGGHDLSASHRFLELPHGAEHCVCNEQNEGGNPFEHFLIWRFLGRKWGGGYFRPGSHSDPNRPEHSTHPSVKPNHDSLQTLLGLGETQTTERHHAQHVHGAFQT